MLFVQYQRTKLLYLEDHTDSPTTSLLLEGNRIEREGNIGNKLGIGSNKYRRYCNSKASLSPVLPATKKENTKPGGLSKWAVVVLIAFGVEDYVSIVMLGIIAL